jgi:hypothetical protein
LSIAQSLKCGGIFSITCAEKQVTARGVDSQGKPLNWACNIVGGDRLKSAVKEVTSTSVVYSRAGEEYRLKLRSRAGSCRQLRDGSIQLAPNKAGVLVMQFDTSRTR